MSHRDIRGLLNGETPQKSVEEEHQKQDAPEVQVEGVPVEVQVKKVSGADEALEEDVVEGVDLDVVVKVAKPNVKFIGERDDKYARGCSVGSVDNAVRVEQGEFAVLRKSSVAPSIGTHHVTPCVVICVTSNNFFGMAHFDSYRTPGSLEEFFKKFKNDGDVTIKIFGGKPGSDPLRSGNENKDAVLTYIRTHLADAEVQITDPDGPPINLVFDKDGTVQQNKFAVGIGVDEELGALMRLRHNMGGIVTAQQSRSGHFMPLNFVEAYQGGDQSIYPDRLALKALNAFDPDPIKGEEQGWSTDPGGLVLTEEMRLAHPTIAYEVNAQKIYMDSQLQESVENASLRKKLIDICPIYIGPHAEAENLKTVKILASLCAEKERPETVIAKALSLFNKASPYPLMSALVSVIETSYKLKKDSLLDALNEKFGDISNLAYGVDIVAPDVVTLINNLRQKENPGLLLTQNLKTNTVDTTKLLSDFSQLYRINGEQLLADVTKEFNKAIAKDENIDKIISTLDQKNTVSKDNVLQVLKNHYSSVKFKFIEKRLDTYWDPAKDPKAALEDIIRKIPPDAEFDWAKEYNDLAKAFHSAHLQTRASEVISGMSFNDKQPGIQG